jgi:predicted nucleotide-binding protein
MDTNLPRVRTPDDQFGPNCGLPDTMDKQWIVINQYACFELGLFFLSVYRAKRAILTPFMRVFMQMQPH